ncbi:tetratricopeptide repeat protein [Chitinophaga sp. 22321]|uniref:Tetratricopeptide repeat protein n=1 Tax=Chitinophaga hostae TaxID=2831022 RepID=A0ABS5IW75_9BACT|nr:tetratricopeptide repeat protein [Chitinophaga hostae]MBS0027150.1 tetratricopeptide repeat protein [Chitinophaga hostae]
MFPFWSDYYYLVIILQIICVIHALKSGRREYLFFILFIPLIGTVVYIVREILPDINTGTLGENLMRTFWPNGRIKEWERKVRMSDTVTNKLQLADAYAQQKQYDKAIALTQECANAFSKDPGILLQLARLQFLNGNYAACLANFDKVNASKGVRMSKAEDELLYAQALEHTGQNERAEAAYQKVIQVHHSLEAMYYYGLLLKKQNRTEEAKAQFRHTSEEIDLHPRYIRRTIRKWVWLSKKELAGM